MEEIKEKCREILTEKVLKRFIKDDKLMEEELTRHLNRVFTSLRSLLPSNLVDKKINFQENNLEVLKGTMMFADIAGFTSLSERLYYTIRYRSKKTMPCRLLIFQENPKIILPEKVEH